jgi:hypothetical protein
VILEARKRENDIIISRSINRDKTLQQIVKKELWNYQKTNQNVSLKTCSVIVTYLQYISHQFYAFFLENMDRTLNQNKDCKFCHDTVSNKILNSNSTCLPPVTED